MIWAINMDMTWKILSFKNIAQTKFGFHLQGHSLFKIQTIRELVLSSNTSDCAVGCVVNFNLVRSFATLEEAACKIEERYQHQEWLHNAQYISYFDKIHLAIWTNTFVNLNKYIQGSIFYNVEKRLHARLKRVTDC